VFTRTRVDSEVKKKKNAGEGGMGPAKEKKVKMQEVGGERIL